MATAALQSFMTSLGAPAAALGVTEGIADAFMSTSKLAGGVLADRPGASRKGIAARRGSCSSGTPTDVYYGFGVATAAHARLGGGVRVLRALPGDWGLWSVAPLRPRDPRPSIRPN